MKLKTSSSYGSLRHELPASHMVYPEEFIHRVKYIFWRLYTPFHPFLRDTCIRLGLVSLKLKEDRWGKRQKFLLGHIAPHESIENVVRHLTTKGYGNHFVAWEDDGEVVSLRYTENFATQYHLRIFEDGEVRGHFEHTPECHPIKHYYSRDCFEPKREHFLGILGDKIIPHESL